MFPFFPNQSAGSPAARALRRLAALAGCAGALLLGGCGRGSYPVVELEADLAQARLYLEALNFRYALEIYRPVYAALPADDPHWNEVAFGYANCLWHVAPPSRQNIGEAAAVFGRIAEVAAGSDWASAARLSLARIEMLRDFPGDVENPAGAIPLLEQLVAEADGYMRHEALLRLAECHRMDFDNPASLRTARQLLLDWLARHPDNPVAGTMWEQIATLELLSFGDPAAALDAFIQAEQAGFGDLARKPMLLWRMAVLGEETGQPALAVRYYRQLILEAPTSGRGYEAQQALRRIRDSVPAMRSIEIPPLAIHGHE